MYASANATVLVSNMDRAVHFYTDTLGLNLRYRFGDHWAAVAVGNGFTIGLHPGKTEGAPLPEGGISIGLELAGSIRDAVRLLEQKGVRFAEPVREGKAGTFAHFRDPDGNPLYLAELNRAHVDQGEGTY